MSEEKDNLREYEADGIREYDNPMPRWWLGLFYVTIIFSLVYMLAIHFFEVTSLEKEAQDDLIARQKLLEAARPAGQADVAASLRDPESIKAGKEVFVTNCAACHGNLGEGGIGPNLTDEYWIHGGSPEDILKTIAQGVPDKGMPPWEPVLGDTKVRQAAAYVISLQGTNPPNAKEPQGNLYKMEKAP